MARERESRVSRITLGAMVVLAPTVATYVLLATLFDATLLDYFPLVSDEIAYQRQIAAFVEAGFGGGYFTVLERPAPFTFTHFSVHGPAFPVIYGLIARVVGWQLYSGPLFNLAVLALATAIFLAMNSLSRPQIVLAGVVILTSWWVLLMTTITMQESLNQAVMIVMAGFATRLVHPDSTRPGRLLTVALVALGIASVLRPTNWIVAVPLVLVGLRQQRPVRVALAALVTALGIPFFWLLWRYVSAPIPDLAIEWTPATSSATVGMIASYFLDHLRSNAAIFEVAPFVAVPFFQHVMFESVVLALVCALLAAMHARRRSAALSVAVFNLLVLGLALFAFLGFYFDAEASISRVMAPFLLLSYLVFVAAQAHTWVVALAVVANLIVAPSFLSAYRDWRHDLFTGDRTRYEEFRAQLAPVLSFDPRRTGWCNTLLTTTYAREIVAVPAGVGLSLGRPAGALEPPIKSGYVLLTPDSVADFDHKARLQRVATTALGDLYANLDASCER